MSLGNCARDETTPTDGRGFGGNDYFGVDANGTQSLPERFIFLSWL